MENLELVNHKTNLDISEDEASSSRLETQSDLGVEHEEKDPITVNYDIGNKKCPIPRHSAVKLEDALYLVQHQPDELEYWSNFLSFMTKKSFIQFVRMEADFWIWDVPVYDGDGFGDFINETFHADLTTDLVKDIVSTFFQRSMLFDLIANNEFNSLLKYTVQTWNIKWRTHTTD